MPVVGIVKHTICYLFYKNIFAKKYNELHMISETSIIMKYICIFMVLSDLIPQCQVANQR